MAQKPKIIFYEEDHRYVNDRGEELVSISNLIGKYKEPFDEDGEIIKRCAAKRNITVEELRKEWDYERDSACERGISFHEQAEYWVKNKEIKDGDYKDVVGQLAQLPFMGKLRSETIVFNNQYKIAGTIDLIENCGNNILNLLDYKTNKALKFKSFFDRESRSYKKMLYPIDHLMDCNFIHYSLQLCGYQILLEEMGYWVQNKTILYVNPKTRILEQITPLELRNEMFEIIKHYNKMQEW